ncbi:hypothetical protein BH20ACT19_BH20ACT19_00470 [soil metagenome]
MGQKSFISVVALLIALIAGAAGAYLYDSSNEGRIAEGATVARVPVGGMTTGEARAAVQEQVAAPLERPVVIKRGGRRFTLSAEDAGVRADVGGMVDEALRESREGNILTRSWRDATGGEADISVAARVSYSEDAVEDLVKRVAKGVDRPAKDATLNFPALTEVASKNGVEVRTRQLERNVGEALLSSVDRKIEVPTRTLRAKVTKEDLAEKYPTLMVVDRGAFELRLYEGLKLQKAYPIAVGQVGLETPAGLYSIQNKAVDPAWSVPNSDWAGSLAGTVVPGGTAENPLKERWLGIYDGAGIHGTDDVGSLGTAASHGCVRMAIPDVIELYDQVEVETPIYIA